MGHGILRMLVPLSHAIQGAMPHYLREKSAIDKQASVLFPTPYALCPMPHAQSTID